MEAAQDRYIEQLLLLLRTKLKERIRALPHLVLPEFGEVMIPLELRDMIFPEDRAVVAHGKTRPSGMLKEIKAGKIVVLTGDFRYIEGALKYLDRRRYDLIDTARLEGIENPFTRSRVKEASCRAALSRLTVIAEGNHLKKVLHPPDLPHMTRWLEEGSLLRRARYILSVRKVLRIASDIKRYREGIEIHALESKISVFPHVFVPSDQKVVRLFADHMEIKKTDRVLDVGTGTGVLALIGAKKGAQAVVATDINSEAVRNARFNAERLGFGNRIEVRGPADLFDSVVGERFDLVLFNAPWIRGTPRTLYDTALYDRDYAVITAFFNSVEDHLNPKGRILLQYSRFSELTGEEALENLHRLISDNGLEIARTWRVMRLGRVLGRRETVLLYEIRRAD